MQEFVSKKSDAGVRADIFVAAQYPQFTRSALEALFDQKLVQINSASAKASHKLKADDVVKVDESLLKTEPSRIKLPVIYEDDDVVIIDKPTGVLTHSKGVLNLEGTVASFIVPKVKGLEGNRAGIVHRLDRGTSGVIITAKNPESLSKLQKQFAKRKAKKTYIAIVEGSLEPSEAVIDAPIMRNPSRPQTFKVGQQGRQAVTKYRAISTFQKGSKTYSKVELLPETGRTHQLRIHMAYVGHPIVGDHVYGHDDGPLMLHASSLEITLPSGERRKFEAPLPLRFKEFIDG